MFGKLELVEEKYKIFANVWLVALTFLYSMNILGAKILHQTFEQIIFCFLAHICQKQESHVSG